MGMGMGMELGHLRYFVAVAEAGSLMVVAQGKLHTSQPSSSRQLRDLEDEAGARLLTRRARGLAFRLLVKEPLMVILPNDHHLVAASSSF
jgi:DNA-binding transcriptional LysR family regulator